MSSPQSVEVEEAEQEIMPNMEDNNPAEDEDDKVVENGDAADDANTSSTRGESPETTPAEEPPEEVVEKTPVKPSQPAPYVYDPNKITLKFIFANRDGVNVIVDCKPTDTVGEVKAMLLSMWPQGERYT